MGQARAVQGGLRFSVERMVEAVRNARKDEVMIDFARQAGTRFAGMAQDFSNLEGSPISAHNNKTLFLEGMDLWYRYYFSGAHDAEASFKTARARDIIVHVMTPWYEAMALDDPSHYRGRLTPPPAYVGDPVDAVASMLGACACLEIQPLQFRFGLEDGVPVHVWGRVNADQKWYDSDILNPNARLGERPKYDSYEEVEIPL